MTFALDANSRIGLTIGADIELKAVGHTDGSLHEIAKLQALQLQVLLSIDERLNDLCDYISWRDAERIKNQ